MELNDFTSLTAEINSSSFVIEYSKNEFAIFNLILNILQVLAKVLRLGEIG